MDFHHLKYFVEVAEQKSFSKAARNLHISQSAISRTIRALEDELGVVLFIRRTDRRGNHLPHPLQARCLYVRAFKNGL